MNNLAALYESQGKNDLVKPLLEDCLAKKKAVLGDSHPSTVGSMYNLVLLYGSQGKYDLALPLWEDCLKKRQCWGTRIQIL
jgi:hypothetical protein